MLKLFILSAVEWMSTNPLSMPVLLQQILRALQLTKASAFPPSPMTFAFVLYGLPRTTARMSAWNPQVSTGFLSTTFSN